MANYHHMLKRKGQTEYEPSGYINIPPWSEGDERRVTVGDAQLYVRVVERMARERVIYTVEIDSFCVVERRTDEKRADLGLVLTNSRTPLPAFGSEPLQSWPWGNNEKSSPSSAQRQQWGRSLRERRSHGSGGSVF
jgi:hypothetical protein